MDYERQEKELKKRTELNYFWGRKQDDEFDLHTNFIYKTDSFDALLKRLNQPLKTIPNMII